MGAGDVLTLAGQFGPLGLMIGYMAWDKVQERKFQRERIAADLELARSLSTLAVRIEGLT